MMVMKMRAMSNLRPLAVWGCARQPVCAFVRTGFHKTPVRVTPGGDDEPVTDEIKTVMGRTMKVLMLSVSNVVLALV